VPKKLQERFLESEKVGA